jgi:hypothetical protein
VLSQVSVVAERAGAGELEPCGVPLLRLLPSDVRWLRGFDRPGCGQVLAAGDLGLGEDGSVLAFPVAGDGADGAALIPLHFTARPQTALTARGNLRIRASGCMRPMAGAETFCTIPLLPGHRRQARYRIPTLGYRT